MQRWIRASVARPTRLLCGLYSTARRRVAARIGIRSSNMSSFLERCRRERNARDGDRQGDRRLRGGGPAPQGLVDAGLFVGAGGVKETRKGARVAFSGKDRTVAKGPFPNINELAA